jgi:hypothetical protein
MEGATATAYAVPFAHREEIAAFYRAVLGADGWRELEPLVFRKGAAELSVRTAAPRGGALPIVVIERSLARAESPPGP